MLLRETIFLRAFSFLKIPLIAYLRPRVIELSGRRIEVKLPLNRRSKNHLNAMYFGALSIGADCAGGLLAMKLIREKKVKISLVFKDFQASFLKRAEGDVHFVCEQGQEIRQFVEQVVKSGGARKYGAPY
jgi:acyl-coenzyme A thioesterase PaaI-like protein